MTEPPLFPGEGCEGHAKSLIVQGYLTYKKTQSLRTLPKAYA